VLRPPLHPRASRIGMHDRRPYGQADDGNLDTVGHKRLCFTSPATRRQLRRSPAGVLRADSRALPGPGPDQQLRTLLASAPDSSPGGSHPTKEEEVFYLHRPRTPRSVTCLIEATLPHSDAAAPAKSERCKPPVRCKPLLSGSSIGSRVSPLLYNHPQSLRYP
jgi:hypothetical protein